MAGMKKIALHWTAGSYSQDYLDFTHYHFTVGKDGMVLGGKFPPEANIPGPTGLQNGHYAAHCGGGNSYCIGVALRGMADYKSPSEVGQYPLTEKQFESGCALIAKLCHENGIQVSPATVFTHYEFGKLHPQTESAGKIDITFLTFKPELAADQVGDYMRGKVEWYLQKMEAGL